MEELAPPRSQLAGRAVADVLLRAGVDRRAVVAAPRVAEPAACHLRVHELGDLELAQVGTLSSCVTTSKISSVSRAAARIRAISSADFRPRSALTIASDGTNRST